LDVTIAKDDEGSTAHKEDEELFLKPIRQPTKPEK
jgi:hypothetical protein